MKQIYEQEFTITPSLADASGKLSVPDTFALFMDIAAIHAQSLGIGPDGMATRDLFWLTVKSQVQFFERPRIMETVRVRTWPDQPGKLRGDRSYQICRGETVLIAGKTEWAVMNIKTGQLSLLDGVYPPELPFDAPRACPEPFARIPDRFDGMDAFAHYTVRATDIDIGGHMNNIAYIRALLGAFPGDALRAMKIRKMDVIFRSPCFEGETLAFQKAESEHGLLLRIARDGATVFLAQIEF